VINYDDVQYSDANMFWKNQYPTKNDMGDKADTFQWHPLATKQFYNAGDDTTDSCGRPAKTMSKPGNLNADQRLQEGTRLPRQATFEPLEHNLLRKMTHAVFTATAYVFADTKHNLNQDIQAKTCIAHTVFVSNKANRKSDEEPKQLPGLETSTLHFLNAKDSDGSSMEKKVEHALYAKSVLMMQMPVYVYLRLSPGPVQYARPHQAHGEVFARCYTRIFQRHVGIQLFKPLPQSYPTAFDERFGEDGITATLSLRSEPEPRTSP
jgi:hypothetical protein